jgi:hypothetical protein
MRPKQHEDDRAASELWNNHGNFPKGPKYFHGSIVESAANRVGNSKTPLFLASH